VEEVLVVVQIIHLTTELMELQTLVAVAAVQEAVITLKPLVELADQEL
jgi:hypothetical protein